MSYLETRCGIFSTQYTLVQHKSGAVTLKAPYINSAGNLKFHKKVFIGKLAEEIKNAFKNKSEILGGYNCATLNDAVNGRL